MPLVYRELSSKRGYERELKRCFKILEQCPDNESIIAYVQTLERRVAIIEDWIALLSYEERAVVEVFINGRMLSGFAQVDASDNGDTAYKYLDRALKRIAINIVIEFDDTLPYTFMDTLR